ncbi:50S ribosomal protein L23P [Haladaptatus paucihalophilus DX253]|uniref:Large ribosomal subunit protein uL23 n=1 Tax=Haladaptatus paucihalophilus DX253 TaxID=797209 RepID=E7QZV4_HALPU|nr:MULTISPECIES: 50S ribosomal protein L23 [Haladaptatus]EFW89848.1 50S ribosomal protein L23P [Haladaptatus paucihalophilus DX253]ODR79422.1 50S ribosomal protein L23 [Haladaptatus sp. W1]GKZ12864.1 50S ribosomal protein L23 [Haladaptatus sp. T7]SHK56019.1 LSU ribosomal protein L23P [Haladaptatus paucihalophilus DX253]
MSVVEYPWVTEKAMNEMDFDNKLQFIVSLDATKPEIRDEIEDRYDVTIEKINTQVTMNGNKKATVSLSDDDDAQDVASRIGVF